VRECEQTDVCCCSYYLSIPSSLLWPMIVLSTIATVIASQAMISGQWWCSPSMLTCFCAGAFSLISQAIALDLFPHIRIVHTSQREGGQVKRAGRVGRVVAPIAQSRSTCPVSTSRSWCSH
jgi:K+ transporter